MPVMPWGERYLCRTAPWRAFARRLTPWATSGETLAGDVLEIGGGSGAMARGLLQRFPAIRLTVTDIDPVMVEAIARLTDGRATTLLADATDLPFADASFDVVTSFLMLHHVGDWERAVADAVRVLRPGGRFVGYDLVDNRRTRAVHHLDNIHDLRAVTAPSLRAALEAADAGAVTLRPGRTGLTLRWVAVRG